MSEQYPGGWLTKSPPTPANSLQATPAPGIWTLDQAAALTKLGLWPTAGNVPATGQQQYTTAGTYSWVAPANCYSVCVVCVGGGGGSIGALQGFGVLPGNGGDSYFIDTSTVKGGGGQGAPGPATNTVGAGTLPNGGTYTGDGGGNGGQGGNFRQTGGGAGGYSGAGGRGSYSGGSNATNGSGGGGAGGYYYSSGSSVGLLGEGSSGVTNSISNPAGGTYNISSGGSGGANSVAYPTSPISGPAGGAGGGGQYDAGVGGGGGGLGYKNNISVTPGTSYTVVVGAGGTRDTGNAYTGAGGAGAVRIIWGAGRAFPSTNTGNL